MRKSLIESGSARKYILYAIGEILLVMIGILLALQVNNWNESRKEKKEVNSIISNLTLEFIQNKELLNKVQEGVYNSLNAALQLITLVGKSEDELIKVNVDSLIYLSWGVGIYTPSENVLTGLLVSDRIDLITSEEIKNLLFQWINELKLKDDRYINVNNATDNKYYDYLSQNYSFKDIDLYSSHVWSEPSNLSYDRYKIFGDLEFENQVENIAFVFSEYGNSLDRLQIILEKVLVALEK